MESITTPIAEMFMYCLKAIVLLGFTAFIAGGLWGILSYALDFLKKGKG